MEYVDAKRFLQQSVIVDVRSPSEFAEGHLPGAVNIPIFTDEERAEIGTLYKQRGREAAIDRGFEIVGPTMRALAQQARAMAKEQQLAVYCWRGGMRSKHMATLFEMADLQCTVLEGGYKAYRAFARDFYSRLNNLTVLAGPTGSGKTDLLHALARGGEQVVDLEGHAHHRGSAFGAIDQPPQPSTEQFQNKVFDAFRLLDPTQRIWIESESKSIGRVYIDETLWEKMNESMVVAIEIPTPIRIDRIVNEYGSYPTEALTNAVQRIARRLGPERVKTCTTCIEEGRLTDAVTMLLQYYDSSYLNSRKKHKKQAARNISLEGERVSAWAEQLMKEVR